MLVTLTCETERATDLGYLLHKNPSSIFEKEMWFGFVRVFYTEVSDERCTVALLLEVDPVGLVRGPGSALDQYVNDRPYVSSSLMSVAISEAFRSALSGRSKERQERVSETMKFTATLAAVRCGGGESVIRKVFEPLGYAVEVKHAVLDERFPEWGDSDIYSVTITGWQTTQAVLSHLYVLIPVLDNSKHYYINEDEIEKLLRHGEGWLNVHPEKEVIASRYLGYR